MSENDFILQRIIDALSDPIVAAVRDVTRDVLENRLPEIREPLMSIDAAAERMAVSTDTVRRLMKAGTIPEIHALGSLRVDPRDVESFIDSQRQEGGAETEHNLT